MDERFWERKPLAELSQEEWEALCDQCGTCCVHKLEDEDTGELVYTNVACASLNLETCRCEDYGNRDKLVPGCVRLTPENIHDVYWLPFTCAYRRLCEGRPLPPWHPLLTHDPDSVHKAGASLRGQAISEKDVKP